MPRFCARRFPYVTRCSGVCYGKPLMKPVAVLTAAAAAIVAVSGCATSAHPAARATPPGTVVLTGWFTWTETPTDGGAYDTTAAQATCDQSGMLPRANAMQVQVRAGDGTVLAAGVPNLQRANQQSTSSTTDFTCGVGWATPPISVQPVYVLSFPGGSRTVNAADAARPVYVAVPPPMYPS